MHVRLATPADAPALMRLNAAFNGPGLNDVFHIERSLRKNPNEIVCIAEMDGYAVGFCCAQLVSSMCYRDQTGEITELYVEPSARRKGIATELIQLAEQELVVRGAVNLKLLTGGDNHAARAFYESLEYESDGEMHYTKLPSLPF